MPAISPIAALPDLIRVVISLAEQPGENGEAQERPPDQPNGNPCEALYAGTFTLADRGMVLEITESIIDQIVQNFNTLSESGRIPISVNHRTSAGTLEEARAVGWVTRLFKQVEGGRISLMMLPRWLDDARQAIEGEQFRFLSCGLMLRDKNVITGQEIGAHVREVSLTNVPAIPGLEPITLTALNSPEKVQLTVERLAGMPGVTALAGDYPLAGSLKQRVECVTRSFYASYPDTNETMWIMRDMSADTCIVSRRNPQGEKTWQLGYTMNASGGCDFAPMNQWTEVRQVYVPVTPAQASSQKPEVELAMKKGMKKPAVPVEEEEQMPGMDEQEMPMRKKMVKTCGDGGNGGGGMRKRMGKERAGQMRQQLAALDGRLTELFNKNHDRRGRFASKGGGGSGTVKKHYAAKKMLEGLSPADRKARLGKWRSAKSGSTESERAKARRSLDRETRARTKKRDAELAGRKKPSLTPPAKPNTNAYKSWALDHMNHAAAALRAAKKGTPQHDAARKEHGKWVQEYYSSGPKNRTR